MKIEPQRVLVVGATGLIGSAVSARLRRDGHVVVGVARHVPRVTPAFLSRLVRLDISRATRAEDWLPLLDDVDAVVNCAGALQDGPGERLAGVHVSGPAALFDACHQAGLRRVIHFSAMGVDRQQPSDFSRTKHQADEILKQSELDWVILRPSVVIGQAAYGASAMFRGLAAMPFLPLMPDTGQLQVVTLEDVTETVARLVGQEAPSRVELELAGPERLEFGEVVSHFRTWLGWRSARSFELPKGLSSLLYRLGDYAGKLGWRPPLRSTAAREIERGATGDPTQWTALTGIRPRALPDALAERPASVQERWFAGLYFLKPLSLVVLSAFWIATGIISLTVGYQSGLDLMRRTPIAPLAALSVIGGALTDLAVGALIAFRRSAWWGLLGGIAVSLFYAAAGTVLLPELWAEPLGPLLKIWPILVLHLMTLAILEDR